MSKRRSIASQTHGNNQLVLPILSNDRHLFTVLNDIQSFKLDWVTEVSCGLNSCGRKILDETEKSVEDQEKSTSSTFHKRSQLDLVDL